MDKKIFLILFFGFCVLFSYSQTIPRVTVVDLQGNNVNSRDIIKNDGNPVLLSFWATWCRPCLQELAAFDMEYVDWQDEFNLKIVAVSTDNPRSTNRVAPFVTSRGWEFDVYLDANHDFKRAMNVGNIPHTFLIDGNGNIVWQHTSYTPGDEQKVYQELLKLKKKK